MKKNILTIIIMAIALVNTVLTALLIFTIVPSANRTNKLVDKVAAIVDLELESVKEEDQLSVADITGFEIDEKLTINLVSTDDELHYAQLKVSLSMNSKDKDFEALNPKVQENVNAIKEIVTDVFSKYTLEQAQKKENKDAIKKEVLTQIQDYFHSDFIIAVSFGNLLLQ